MLRGGTQNNEYCFAMVKRACRFTLLKCKRRFWPLWALYVELPALCELLHSIAGDNPRYRVIVCFDKRYHHREGFIAELCKLLKTFIIRTAVCWCPTMRSKTHAEWWSHSLVSCANAVCIVSTLFCAHRIIILSNTLKMHTAVLVSLVTSLTRYACSK